MAMRRAVCFCCALDAAECCSLRGYGMAASSFAFAPAGGASNTGFATGEPFREGAILQAASRIMPVEKHAERMCSTPADIVLHRARSTPRQGGLEARGVGPPGAQPSLPEFLYLRIQVDVEGLQHPGNAVSECSIAATGKEQCDRIPGRVPGPNRRTGITAGTERIRVHALNRNLIDEPGHPAATVIDVDGHTDCGDATLSQLRGASGFADEHSE